VGIRRREYAQPPSFNHGTAPLALSLTLLLILPSCVRKKDTGVFVARVNNEYLTPEKMKGTMDSAAFASGPRVREFVTNWINASLLYEEAKVRGLDRSPEVNETLAEMRRQMAVNRLIEGELYGNESLQSTDDEIRAFYDQHRAEFQLTENVAKVRCALFSNRETANVFRSQLAKGKSWADVLQNLAQDSMLASSLIMRADSAYIRQSQAPQWLSPSGGRDLWRAASQLQVGESTPIVKVDPGYCILTLLRMQSEGEIAELPMVELEIRDRLVIEKRQKALDRFLESLRKKYAVQVNLAAIEGTDSTKEAK
jgi:hypothetical protein